MGLVIGWLDKGLAFLGWESSNIYIPFWGYGSVLAKNPLPEFLDPSTQNVAVFTIRLKTFTLLIFSLASFCPLLLCPWTYTSLFYHLPKKTPLFLLGLGRSSHLSGLVGGGGLGNYFFYGFLAGSCVLVSWPILPAMGIWCLKFLSLFDFCRVNWLFTWNSLQLRDIQLS